MRQGTRIMVITNNYLAGEVFKAYFDNHPGGYQVVFRTPDRMADVPPELAPSVLVLLGMEKWPVETKAAMALYPLSKYLLVGSLSDTLAAVEWLRFGIHGLIDESSETSNLEVFEKALSKVQEGELWASRKIMARLFQKEQAPGDNVESLTRREEEIMRLLNLGLSNPMIGDRLKISEKTVKRHLTNIYKKMEVHNRIQAVLKHQGEGSSPATLYSFPVKAPKTSLSAARPASRSGFLQPGRRSR